MVELSCIENAYEKNPVAFFLFQAVEGENSVVKLSNLYANPAAKSLEDFSDEWLRTMLENRLSEEWIESLGDLKSAEGKTIYSDRKQHRFRMDCFPVGSKCFGCMVQNWEDDEHLSDERQKLLYWDKLTGALNFQGFKRKALNLLFKNPQYNYAIWYCDIRNFKYINDAFGYDKGDALLCHWAEVVRKDLCDDEIFGRIAGDQLVLLTHYEDKSELEERFNNQINKVRGFLSKHRRGFEVEIKAGIYLLDGGNTYFELENINQMLDRANGAQKEVKHLPGCRLAFFTDDQWKNRLREMAITQRVSEAIETGEFYIVFQPQYNTVTNMVCGAEALVRWVHKDLGFLSPGEFIPLLEETGQITELDWYIWEECCKIMRNWIDSGRENIVPISVNISRKDILDERLCESIYNLVCQYNLSPQMLRLEITESAYMKEPEQLISVVTRLRDYGFTVEMDDFGSGYSSLNMLKDVPVDILKLDMKFLAGDSNSLKGGNIISSVIRMAQWLDLSVIAEGVETKEQSEYLSTLGCYTMQGYYFAKPMKLDEFEEFVDQNSASDMEVSEPNVNLEKLNEFIDAGSSQSFLFNTCIGGSALVEYNGEDVVALTVNRAFPNTLGMLHEEFDHYRTHMMDIVAQNDRGIVRATIDEAIESGYAYCEVRLDSQKNKQTWIRMSYRCLSSNSKNYILFVLIEDVTTQHKLWKDLDKVSDEINNCFDIMQGGMIRYTADEVGHFNFVSRGFLNMLGYTIEQFSKRFNNSFINMVYEEDRDKLTPLKDIDVKGSSFESYRIEAADGSLKWVNHTGRLVKGLGGEDCIYAIISDIDAKEQAEKDKVIQNYTKTITGLFDEVLCVDYSNDSVVVLSTTLLDAQIGIEYNPIYEILSSFAEQWSITEENKKDFIQFVSQENIKESCNLDYFHTLEIQVSGGEWYKCTLLPENENRAMLCVSNMTVQKSWDEFMVETAKMDALQDYVSSMPLGLGVFKITPDGNRELQFMNNDVAEVLRMSEEDARYFLHSPDTDNCIPDMEYMFMWLNGGNPYEEQYIIPCEEELHKVNIAIWFVQEDGAEDITAYFILKDISGRMVNREDEMKERISDILVEMPQVVAFEYDPETDTMTNFLSLKEEESKEVVIENYLGQLNDEANLSEIQDYFLRESILASLKDGYNNSVDFQADYFGEGVRWVRAHYATMIDDDGNVCRVIGRIDDIQEEISREAFLRDQIEHDALTGLYSYDAVRYKIEKLIDKDEGSVMFIIDLDDFKKVNDTLGHLAGDELLRKTAEAIKSGFRKDDIVTRFGGDEFLVYALGKNFTREVVNCKAAEIIKNIQSIEVPELGNVRCSIGVTMSQSGSKISEQELFAQADFALYEAKHRGKGCHVVFDDALQVKMLLNVVEGRYN